MLVTRAMYCLQDEAMFLLQTVIVIRQYKYVLYLELITFFLVFTLFGLNNMWMRIFPDVFLGPPLWLVSQYQPACPARPALPRPALPCPALPATTRSNSHTTVPVPVGAQPGCV